MTKADLKTEVSEADKRARDGRITRLQVLRNADPLENCPVPALAHEYFEEARLCWYAGAFVATIIMVQLTFEEFLRSHYRAARGIGGELDSAVRVDRAGFVDLVSQAKTDTFLTLSEADDLLVLKDCRNPYVHTKDYGSKGPNFFSQLAKIAAPQVVGLGVEDEARGAIELLLRLFPVLCKRMM